MLPHTLDISDIYVQLTELSRTAEFRVEEFATEPASWWRDVDEGIIKPDAFAMVAKARRLNMWWIEVERGREPVSVVVKQLGIYLRFAWHGRPGPHEVIPRVLVTVPSTTRRRALTRAIDRLDDPAPRLIKVALHADAAGVVAQVLEDAVRRSDDDTADT